MPKIFEKDGFRFFFYANDHEPVHVHVSYAGGEAIFILGIDIELRESVGFKVKDLRRAQELAEENRQLILSKWNEFFNR
jgi:Domain of unknown function (DUF4160)